MQKIIPQEGNLVRVDVREKDWQQWMTKIASWFVEADVHYFDASQGAQAERWVREK